MGVMEIFIGCPGNIW